MTEIDPTKPVTASPFLIGKVRDPESQLVRPALDGTRNVLGSVNATESVKRVVLTSSVDHQPYPYSKTVAEQAAWVICGAQDRWDLVTIHPGWCSVRRSPPRASQARWPR